MAADRNPSRAAPALRRGAEDCSRSNLPVIYFAVPRVYVATSTRVTGATPAPVRPPILWNADAIGVMR